MRAAFAVRKNSNELREALDGVLKEMWADGSLNKIKRVYLDPLEIVFYGILCAHFTHQKMVAGFYGSRRSAIELPGGVNDSSCHEKVEESRPQTAVLGCREVLAETACPTKPPYGRSWVSLRRLDKSENSRASRISLGGVRRVMLGVLPFWPRSSVHVRFGRVVG